MSGDFLLFTAFLRLLLLLLLLLLLVLLLPLLLMRVLLLLVLLFPSAFPVLSEDRLFPVLARWVAALSRAVLTSSDSSCFFALFLFVPVVVSWLLSESSAAWSRSLLTYVSSLPAKVMNSSSCGFLFSTPPPEVGCMAAAFVCKCEWFVARRGALVCEYSLFVLRWGVTNKLVISICRRGSKLNHLLHAAPVP